MNPTFGVDVTSLRRAPAKRKMGQSLFTRLYKTFLTLRGANFQINVLSFEDLRYIYNLYVK